MFKVNRPEPLHLTKTQKGFSDSVKIIVRPLFNNLIVKWHIETVITFRFVEFKYKTSNNVIVHAIVNYWRHVQLITDFFGSQS